MKPASLFWIPAGGRTTSEISLLSCLYFSSMPPPILWHNSANICKATATQWKISLTDAALSTDFEIEDSFGQVSKQFEEHYGFKISPTTVVRVTKESALGCQAYVEERLQPEINVCEQAKKPSGLTEPMLIQSMVAKSEPAP